MCGNCVNSVPKTTKTPVKKHFFLILAIFLCSLYTGTLHLDFPKTDEVVNLRFSPARDFSFSLAFVVSC